MDEYVEVKIDIFEHTGQRAKILRNLTISGLIDEIFKEFDDIPADNPAKYAVFLKGNPKPLKAISTITELDLQPQDELTFEYRHQSVREMLQPQDFAYLTDDVTGRRFEIQWQPALIGRPTAEVEHNLILAINMELLPKGMTISRRHAQITFSDDKYYVEPLAENNPVIVNGKEMPMGAMWEIKNGDRITLGRYNVTLGFATLPHSPAASRDNRSQAAAPVTPKQAPAVSPQPSPPAPVQSAQAVVSPSANESGQVGAGGTVLDLGAVKYSNLIIEKATLPDSVGQRIDIANYPFIIGRSLPVFSVEKGVSRQHGEINFDPQTGKFTFKDLNSTNGSKIEGVDLTPQTPYEIKPGFRMNLGQDVVVRFEM